MSRFLKFVLVMIFPVLVIGITSVTMMAQPGDEDLPGRKPITSSSEPKAEPSRSDGVPIILDGSFEAGSPNASWEESSSNFGTPICDQTCVEGTPLGNYAKSGNYWAWFGSAGDVFNEHAILTQTVTIPDYAVAQLEFYFYYFHKGDGAQGNDYFRVSIDGNQIFEINDTVVDFSQYDDPNYTKVSLNLNSYTDGQAHTLVFESYIGDGEGVDYFFLDDVRIVGAAEARLYLPLALNCNTPVYAEPIRYNISTINAPNMWAIEDNCKPSPWSEITIAIIDTGVDLNHPDLQTNLVPGATFVDGTIVPEDDHGHGTHVAGIAAASMNDFGVIGVAPNANIMPIKVLDQNGSGLIVDVAAAIQWAADNGADIINLSLGGSSATLVERDAINYATGKGALVVAAAGNCGDPATYLLNRCPSLDAISYPAAFDNAMAVASTDQNNQQSSFSTQNSYVEIAAPGSDIFSTYLGGTYFSGGGTSQATPHVAGLAAAVWSLNPSLTNTQVRTILNDTAVDLGSPGRDIQFGNGRIDAFAAASQSLQATGLSAPVTGVQAAPESISPNLDAPHAGGEVIVKLTEGVSVHSLASLNGQHPNIFSSDDVTISQIAGIDDVYMFTVPVGEEVDYMTRFNEMEGVEYAELNYIVTIP